MRIKRKYFLPVLMIQVLFCLSLNVIAGNKSPWRLTLSDSMHKNWHKNWFLDGEVVEVKNAKDGMTIWGGPEILNDAHHGVLWTKKEFEGDIRIEYDYTRLDTMLNLTAVTILYVHAQGDGTKENPSDITKWNDERRIPAMKTYFNRMNSYHISYAAAEPSKDKKTTVDYIRARRYNPALKSGLKGTDFSAEYLNNDLFKVGVKYHVTFMLDGDQIFFIVKGDGKEVVCTFDRNEHPNLTKGRIGLRHMYTRGAKYENFKVYQKK